MLNIPAPKVHAWSARADESPVGAEYIIMEKAKGTQLAEVWHGLQPQEKFRIVEQLVRYDVALASSPFEKFGSLYYATDVSCPGAGHQLAHNGHDLPARFYLGPTNHRRFFDNGRFSLDLDRGPCKCLELMMRQSVDYFPGPTVQDFVVAAAHRELTSVQQLERLPQPQGIFNGPGQYIRDKSKKERTLRKYMALAPYLIPSDKSFHAPVLWHPDLHTDNIFIDPGDLTKITAIIDWQSTHIAPLFLQVRHPALLDYEGPTPEKLEPPPLPSNFDELTAEQQLEAKQLRVLQTLYILYDVDMLRMFKPAGRALRGQGTLKSRITGLAGSIFTDGEPIVLGGLIRAVDEWNTVVGANAEGSPLTPCPLSFSEEERRQQKEDEVKWAQGVELKAEMISQLGAYNGWDGWVKHQEYQLMKSRLAECHERFLDRMATTNKERKQWAEAWPFRSGND